MHRHAALLELCQQVRAALQPPDWAALEMLNGAMAGKLTQLATQGAWNSAEKTVLLQLRKIQEVAITICAEEKGRLQQHLSGLQTNKEGWIAYAINGESDSNRN